MHIFIMLNQGLCKPQPTYFKRSTDDFLSSGRLAFAGFLCHDLLVPILTVCMTSDLLDLHLSPKLYFSVKATMLRHCQSEVLSK